MTEELTDADRRIHELEGKLADTTSELETTRAELRRRETTIESMHTAELRRGIAEETGMPERILVGSTREELMTCVKELKAWAKKPAQSADRQTSHAPSGPLRSGAGRAPSTTTKREAAVFHARGDVTPVAALHL